MNRLHLVGVAEDPLLVGIGRIVVGWCAVWLSERNVDIFPMRQKKNVFLINSQAICLD